MDIVSSFADLLQVFATTMTSATHDNLRDLVVGWVFAPRRTIMGMIRAGGTKRHHSAFHRLFATAKWSIDKAGLAVVTAHDADQAGNVHYLVIDNTIHSVLTSRV